MPYAEIELSLNPLGQSLYQVDLRINDPGSEGAIPPATGKATLSTAPLEDSESNPLEYGQTLTNLLFNDGKIRESWIKARAALDKSGLDIRFRLLLAPGDLLLNSIRWELLLDPDSKKPIATEQRILFSRFLFSNDWRPINLRAKGDLTAVIAVAAPTDLEAWNLAPVIVDDQIKPVAEAMSPLVLRILPQPLTLVSLIDAFKSSPDILYLVAHGTIDDQLRPQLMLANEEGKSALTFGQDLTDALAQLNPLPRLVVLASCQSAGFASSVQTSFAALLANAGIPAVVAMQGNISMKSVQEAMPRFFKELFSDGQIDRALSAARFEVRDNHDAWMPALLLRLKSGRIWYEPGFRSATATANFWTSICLQIKEGNALPIIGPDLAEETLGFSSSLAKDLADYKKFPLSSPDSTDLAKVAQYLTITEGPDATFKTVQDLIMQNAQAAYPQTELLEDFDSLFGKIAEIEANNPRFALQIVSHLPLKTFVDASSTPLLFHSLKSAGKQPIVNEISWRPLKGSPPPVAVETDERKLDIQNPVVYNFFGSCDTTNNWVLTEDDFFDFTVRTSQYKLIPSHVSRVFSEKSLLFLGFSLDSWTFRALFRMIMLQEGTKGLQQGKTHIGVQLDPEDSRYSDPERARQYLIEYFKSDKRGSVGEPEIEVYWGSSADFLRELANQLENNRKAPVIPRRIPPRGPNARS